MATACTRFQVRVAPGGRESVVLGRHGTAWKLRVAAAPERGRANDEVVALLARTLELKPPAVRIVSGRGARDKVIEVGGLTADEVERRLAAAGKEAS